MDDRHIAPALIHRIAPFPRHFQTSAPSIRPGICIWCFGDEIAIVKTMGILVGDMNSAIGIHTAASVPPEL
jgi:hypothetical protein